ncbi:YciI family protein [Micromonospora sonneratiae]|uniref:YciI family protein n=1 Tax=Micromonospora sonneratiae TaxID=1184706 RepID=A0ABW3Y8S5_9ACTN
MKFMLIMHMNPQVWDALTEEERKEVMRGHGGFIDSVRSSGELVGTTALADPSSSAVVRVRDGMPVVTDGPYLEAKEYLGGYYLVDCENRERALELAAMIPDARVAGLGIEVRPVIFTAGAEPELAAGEPA